jgi:Carboxypeptidase regulatory-like domain
MRNVITILVCVVCLSAASSAALAQSQLGSGSISGTVSDSHGAAIAGATVTITNTGTRLVRTLTTGDSGQFSAPALPVGEYAARVEKTGFSTLDQIGLIVNVGGTTTLRLELKPGAANEVINIIAEQTLDAARTEETTLINRTQINDLPINGRRADQLPDIPRNSKYGDSNYRFDLRVARDIKIGDKFVVELLGESFNLFNRSNFNGFNSTLYDAVFPLVPGTTTRYSTANPPPLATPIPLTKRANFGAPNNDGSQPDGTNARRFQLALRFQF